MDAARSRANASDHGVAAMDIDNKSDGTGNSRASHCYMAGSLFSGCGGMDLGLHRAGFGVALQLTPTVREYLWQCEESQSEVVEMVIRRTKAFKQWLESRPG